MISSTLHQMADLSLKDLNFDDDADDEEKIEGGKLKGFLNLLPYANSKMANILFARELARKLRYCESGINTYALCPGLVRTDLFLQENVSWKKKLLYRATIGISGLSVQKVLSLDLKFDLF